MISDASATQRLLLDRIACCSRALVVTIALILDGITRTAFFIDKEHVYAFGIDAAESFRVFAAKDFAQRNLRHHAPTGPAARYNFAKLFENTRLAVVEERAGVELCLHDDAKLVCRIQSPRLFRARVPTR